MEFLRLPITWSLITHHLSHITYHTSLIIYYPLPITDFYITEGHYFKIISV